MSGNDVFEFSLSMTEHIREFSPDVIEHLKNYVYCLSDPRNGETFYIGKGSGNRVLAHARGDIDLGKNEDYLSEKLETIGEIKEAGLEPIPILHRHGMDENTAMEVAAALIDSITSLAHSKRAKYSNHRGPANVQELQDRYHNLGNRDIEDSVSQSSLPMTIPSRDLAMVKQAGSLLPLDPTGNGGVLRAVVAAGKAKVVGSLPTVPRHLMEMPASALAAVVGNRPGGGEPHDKDGGQSTRLNTGLYELFARAAAAIGIGAVIVERAAPMSLEEMEEKSSYVAETLDSRRGDFSADQLWELIPETIRTKVSATEEFLKERDLSHIVSVKNNPAAESDIANLIFEKASWNRSRGAQNMTGSELFRAQLDNFAESLVPALQSTADGALRGALMGALLELPVSAAENFILVRGGGKPWQEAAKDVAKDAGKKALHGAGGAAVCTGVAMFGVGVNQIALPLAIVGGVTYLWSASGRIWRAIDATNPDKSTLEAIEVEATALAMAP